MMKRCSWVTNDKTYIDYHDNEWGVPVYDDRKLFEMLLLEAFHAGLSWFIVLKKRENFRVAFDNFDYALISKYDDKKVEELLEDAGIVRSGNKIRSAISNAKIYMNIQEEYGTFSKYLWGFSDNKVVCGDEPDRLLEIAEKISKDLKKRGMKYVGSVTIYAYLEGVGVFNNHQDGCFKRICVL